GVRLSERLDRRLARLGAEPSGRGGGRGFRAGRTAPDAWGTGGPRLAAGRGGGHRLGCRSAVPGRLCLRPAGARRGAPPAGRSAGRRAVADRRRGYPRDPGGDRRRRLAERRGGGGACRSCRARRMKLLFWRRPRIGVIELHGVLSARPGALNARAFAPLIERAFRAAGKGGNVILDIDSPGGSPVQSDLIASLVRRHADKAGARVTAVIAEVGASGGYWLA